MGFYPGLVFLAVIIYGGVHSFLASLAAKNWARRRLGHAAGRGYRLAYNIFGVLSLLPVLALPALLPDRVLYSIPYPWVLLTGLLQAVALLLLVVGVLQTGAMSFLGLKQLFDPDPEAGPSQLVVGGLYRFVRHPLYTAGLVLLWLVPVMTANLLGLILGLTVYIIIGAVFEERKLLNEFGEVYERYRQVTPMLLPGLRPGRGQTQRRASQR
jgi:methanethiol S-methyltransferase